jgi:hypothetical protein
MENNSFVRRTRANHVSVIGGLVGLVTFLVVGLLPSLLYGGYAGVIVGGAIFGTPVHESVFAQATVFLGAIAGVFSIGGVFVLGGAILTTGAHGLLAALSVGPEMESMPSDLLGHAEGTP